MRPPYHPAGTFLRAPTAPAGNGRPCVAVLGALFDMTTCYRPGARFGPAAIRNASGMYSEDDDAETGGNPFDLFDLFDAGDVVPQPADIAGGLAGIETRAGALIDAGAHVLALGGDHLVTLPLLRATARRYGRLALVHFDAHCDTWPPDPGAPRYHGSPMRAAIEEGLVDPAATVQIGLRSPVARDVAAWTRAQGVHWITAEAVLRGDPEAIAAHVAGIVGDRPAYLTFDIDVLDPSQTPGVSTPETAGIWSWQALAIIRALAPLRWVGADIVEVCPPYDVSEITAMAAANVAWTYLVHGGPKPLAG